MNPLEKGEPKSTEWWAIIDLMGQTNKERNVQR